MSKSVLALVSNSSSSLSFNSAVADEVEADEVEADEVEADEVEADEVKPTCRWYNSMRS
jgi:predicted transcriptional regulator